MKIQPVVGNVVRVEVVNKTNLLPALYPNEPTTVIYEGRVVGRAEYDPPDSIRISSDDMRIPVRVISFASVVSWDGQAVDREKMSATFGSSQTFDVVGSKGAKYLITVDPQGRGSCTCSGFGFRRTCSHVDKILASLAKE